MKKLIEQLENFVKRPTADEVYDAVMTLFTSGTLPGGGKWREIPSVVVRFREPVEISKVTQEEGENGTIFNFEMKVQPGGGGGCGAGIDPFLSDHFFNLIEPTPKAIAGAGRALSELAEKSRADIATAIHRWLSDPENWIYKITGWDIRAKWGKPSTKIISLTMGKPMSDPYRRADWPAGFVEMWIPFTAKIQAEVKRK